MPTSTNVTSLKINTLTEAQYDTAVQGGVISANELSILTDAEAGQVIQYATIPEDMPEGTIFQYIGEDTDSLKNGLFYKKIIVPDPGEYEVIDWFEDSYQPISFTPLSFNGNYIAMFFEQVRSFYPQYAQDIIDVLNGEKQGAFMYQGGQWYMGVAVYNEQGWYDLIPGFVVDPIENFMTYEGTPADSDTIVFTLGSSGEPGTRAEYEPVKTMAVIDDAIQGSTDAISSGGVYNIQYTLSASIQNKMENILYENLPEWPTSDTNTCLVVGDTANVPEGGIYRWGSDLGAVTLMGNVTAKTTSQSITDIVLLTIDFLNKAAEGGMSIPENSTETYSITYNATDVVWEASWGNTYSDLSSELGISYTGTPDDGDTIEITITNYQEEAWKLVNGTTSTPLIPYGFYADSVIQYTGVTDGDWVNGYFYKCIPNPDFAIETSATQISGSSLEGLLVDEMLFRDEFIRGYSPILSKTMTADFIFNENENLWYCSEQIAFDDLSYIGITWESGTPVDGDTIRVMYSQPDSVIWEQVNTQPASDGLPDQTGNAGKFLITDGTDANWGTSITGGLSVNFDSGNNNFILVSNKNNNEQFHINANYNSKLVNFEGPYGCPDFTMSGFNGQRAIYSSTATQYVDVTLGQSGNKWANVYTRKINNGADITVPAVAGSMAVQVSTIPTADSTLEGQIYQFVGVTDSTYTNGRFYKCVSDGQTPATYSWTEVSMGGGSSYTAGTGIDITSGVISVTSPTLTNTATGTNSLAVGGTIGAFETNCTAIGRSSQASTYSQAFGYNVKASGNSSIAVGYSAQTTGGSAIAIGVGAKSTSANAIQLGGINGTNSDANTFKVGNANGNFEMMSADGTIPHARLTNAVQSTTVTIATTDWSSNTASVTVSGLTATSVVWVAPDNASQSAYTTAGVYASSQSADTLTFTCTQTPSASLTINVVFC